MFRVFHFFYIFETIERVFNILEIPTCVTSDYILHWYSYIIQYLYIDHKVKFAFKEGSLQCIAVNIMGPKIPKSYENVNHTKMVSKRKGQKDLSSLKQGIYLPKPPSLPALVHIGSPPTLNDENVNDINAFLLYDIHPCKLIICLCVCKLLICLCVCKLLMFLCVCKFFICVFPGVTRNEDHVFGEDDKERH